MKNEIVIDGTTYVPKGSERTTQVKPQKGLTYCIIRTYSAGVFAGWINRKFTGKEATIYNSRRVWYWDGANCLSDLAVNGTSKPNECKIANVVEETDLKEIIEIIPISEKAAKIIAGVKEWVK